MLLGYGDSIKVDRFHKLRDTNNYLFNIKTPQVKLTINYMHQRAAGCQILCICNVCIKIMSAKECKLRSLEKWTAERENSHHLLPLQSVAQRDRKKTNFILLEFVQFIIIFPTIQTFYYINLAINQTVHHCSHPSISQKRIHLFLNKQLNTVLARMQKIIGKQKMQQLKQNKSKL